MPLLDSIIKNRSAILPLGRWCHIPEYPIAKKDVLEWKIHQKETRNLIREKGIDPYVLIIRKNNQKDKVHENIEKKQDEDEEYMRPYVIDW